MGQLLSKLKWFRPGHSNTPAPPTPSAGQTTLNHSNGPPFRQSAEFRESRSTATPTPRPMSSSSNTGRLQPPNRASTLPPYHSRPYLLEVSASHPSAGPSSRPNDLFLATTLGTNSATAPANPELAPSRMSRIISDILPGLKEGLEIAKKGLDGVPGFKVIPEICLEIISCYEVFICST